MAKLAFIITIDTEGDNLWENHNHISTENTHFLPRFQALCEKYAFKPVYLTNYEMALDKEYVTFARDLIARDVGEIGMHLHAWNSPPTQPLTDDDCRYKPYLIEYPREQMRSKVEFMTCMLEKTFQTKMLSHRAGRWAFNEYYAALLIKFGYLVDCSVTPKVNWQSSQGNPSGKGGTDYSVFPSHAYFVDENHINCTGRSSLLEVPMTIQYRHSGVMNTLKKCYNYLRGKHRSPSVHWLRPTGGNLKIMKHVVQKSIDEGHDYVEFMLHSSELMPGGSPMFPTEHHIEILYCDLEQLFSWLSERTVGKTLAEYYKDKIKNK